VGFFIYDRSEDAIVQLTEDEYDELNNTINSVDAKNDVIKRFNKHGLCLQNSVQLIEHPATANIMTYLNTSVENLVLQVTQECNLRCDYCTYSVLYKNRSFSERKMSLNVAKAAVDFAVNHSSGSNKLVVGFYGGEPLLEIDLIKQVINYIEEVYPNKNISYNFTTNGTLLTDDIVDFLVKKDVDLMVSIDGPKREHDKQRRFPNNDGSFDLIMNNLNRIKYRHPDYFSTITTNTVLNPEHEYSCVRDFFKIDNVMGHMTHMFGIINDVGLKEPISYDETLSLINREEIFKVLLNMIGEIEISLISPLHSSYKAQITSRYNTMKLGGVKSKTAHPGGPCIPGSRKSFIDVEGNIHICERIVEDNNFIIGNIFDGFDKSSVLKMLNIGRLTANECINCWAFKHCTICVAQIIEDGHISKEAKLERCSQVVHNVISEFMDMAVLMHYGYDFEKHS